MRSRVPALFVVVTLGLSACGSSPPGSSGPSESDPVPEAPVIEFFTASPDQVQDGEASELSWEVSDPTATVRIAPLGQEVSGTSISVVPVATTTYTLTASNLAGSTMATTVVRVIAGDRTATSVSGGPEAGTATDAVGDWVPVANNLVGQPTECGNISFVSAHPERDMVIAGVALNGLWATTGQGQDWVKLGSNGSTQVLNRATNIVYDPSNPDRWWESGIYTGPGVVVTTDNGSSFRALGDVSNSDLVSVDLNDPGRLTMLSGTHERTQLLRSRDGGATWEDITAGLPGNIGFTASVHVIDQSTYLVGTKPSFNADDTANVGIFRTDNGGFTWDRVFDAGVIGRPLVLADGTMHWLLARGLGMVTSTDAGLTWSFSGSGPSADPAMSLVALPDGAIATTADDLVITSADGGATWRRVGPRLPFAVAGITYSPSQNTFYAWQSDCTTEIREDSIVRLDLNTLAD